MTPLLHFGAIMTATRDDQKAEIDNTVFCRYYDASFFRGRLVLIEIKQAVMQEKKSKEKGCHFKNLSFHLLVAIPRK
jgi:hypothetical protein